MTEPKIVKRVHAETLEDGLAHHWRPYWMEIVSPGTTWVIRPDGSLAGVVVQIRTED